MNRQKSLIIGAILAGAVASAPIMAQAAAAIAFSTPPIMGESKFSKDGIQIEMVREILKVSSTDLDVQMLPRVRANVTFEEGTVPLYLGPINTVSPAFAKHVTEVPLFAVQSNIFYKKAKVPNFSYSQASDLQKYTVGTTGGSSSEKAAIAAGIKVDPAPNVNSMFQKLDAGRTDVVISIDLGGLLAIDELFPGRAAEFDYYKETPFLFTVAKVIVNNDNPQSKALLTKLNSGLKAIYANGTWQKVMEKYYGKGNVPKSSIKIVEDYLKSK